MLVASPDAARLDPAVRLTPPEPGSVMARAARAWLASADAVFVVRLGDLELDDAIQRSQDELASGMPFASTLIARVVVETARCSRAAILWYGDDFADLEPVRDIAGLARRIEDEMGDREGCAEFYLRYAAPSPQR
jgi:hypothetical protein